MFNVAPFYLFISNKLKVVYTAPLAYLKYTYIEGSIILYLFKIYSR